MTECNVLKSLYEISNNYDAYIVDIWGVLWDGIEAYDHAKNTLEKLKEKKKKYRIAF